MRARLAVLVAVSIVFAPGWGGDQLAVENRSSVEVGARMLAPTFDEAAEQDAGRTQKRLERPSTRSDRSKLIPWRTTSDSPTLPLGLVLTAAIAVAFFHVSGDSRQRSGRAPPHPLTA